MKVTLFIFVATVTLATSQLLVATATATTALPLQLHLLRPVSGDAVHHTPHISCLSWRLAVETNNIIGWDIVPAFCADYVAHYMLGPQYLKDCHAVTRVAFKYAKTLNLTGDGKDIWVFDVDETALSELPYYALPDVAFGSKEFNSTKKNEYIKEAKAPPLLPVLGLYKKLLSLGYKIVFISATSESYRDARILNLKRAGYYTWEKLILKQTADHGLTSLVYKANKRKELVEAGYRILGNMGDQWSDITSTDAGNRTFKLPNPMYYVP